jgi:hypothetical protein
MVMVMEDDVDDGPNASVLHYPYPSPRPVISSWPSRR